MNSSRMTLGRAALIAAAAALGLSAASPAAAGPSILFDAGTGKVLYAEDVGQAWHPASTTKLITAYIVIEAVKAGKLNLSDMLTVSETAAKAPPSKLGLKPGQSISVDMALKALMIKSANDMSVVLAERIGGSVAGFADVMNTTSRRLGMKDSSWVNPNGLPDNGQITTVRDMAILAAAIIRDHPDFADLFKTASMTYGKAKLASHNRLLQTFPGADGMKTGFICDSGYNIVASATRGGKRLVAVVFGANSAAARNVRAAAMLEFGFQNLDWKLATSNRTLATVDNAPSDNAKPYKIRTQVMNWDCGWRPSKEQLAAMRIEEQVDVPVASTGKVKPNQAKAGWVTTKDAGKKTAAKAKKPKSAAPQSTATTDPAAP